MFDQFPEKSNRFQDFPYWLGWFESQLPKNLSVQYLVGKKKKALEMLEYGKQLFYEKNEC